MSDTNDGTADSTDLTDKEVSELSPEMQVWHAIDNGADTKREIADMTALSTGWTESVLSDLEESGSLEVTDAGGTNLYERAEPEDVTDDSRKESIEDRDGDDTVEGVEPDTVEPTAEPDIDDDMRIPVDRDYNWDSHKLDPDSVADYVDTNGEYEDMQAEIALRDKIGKPPRFRMTGPTGCGKTTAGEALAIEFDAPTFIIECHDGLRPNNLLGTPAYVGDETLFVDGPVTKALLASEAANRDDTDFDEVFLIFDEVNRTTSRTLGVVMGALDHRAEVTLHSRGGEVIKGDPMNLVTVCTMNEGSEYIGTNPIDRAQKRRFGNTYEVDYIGMNDKQAEVDLLVENTGVDSDVAGKMVECANDIRQRADADDGKIQSGLPTSTMLDWAKTAHGYAVTDRTADGGPVLKAARRAVIEPFYGDGGRETDAVETAIESHVRGLDVSLGTADEDESESDDDDDSDAESADEGIGEADASDDAYDTDIETSDDAYLQCEDCGEFGEVGELDEDAVATMTCWECDGRLHPHEP